MLSDEHSYISTTLDASSDTISNPVKQCTRYTPHRKNKPHYSIRQHTGAVSYSKLNIGLLFRRQYVLCSLTIFGSLYVTVGICDLIA